MKNLKLSGIVSTFTFHDYNRIVDLLSDNIVAFPIGYNLVDAFTFDHHL